jgi:serine protease Do
MNRLSLQRSASFMLRVFPVFAVLAVGLVFAREVQCSERDNYSVKSAFRDVIAAPNRSTVRVRSRGYVVALGTIVGADGLILTKSSELKGELECHFGDGVRIPASLVATDDQYDLALLKVDASDLPVIEWQVGEAPRVGSWLAAPGQEAIPIAIGVVSVEPREIKRRIAVVGIRIDDGEQGPRVDSVLEGSGAEDAGVQAEDIITHLDGKRCPDRKTFIDAIRLRRPGEVVRLTLLRGDKTLELPVRLSDLRRLTEESTQFPEAVSGRLSQRRAGFPVALQHDMVLEPRHCGGAVVNLDGKAVGVNIARADRVATYAIPASTVLEVLDRMKAKTLVSTQPAD